MSPSPAPPNVLDPRLYLDIKKKIHEDLQKQGKRWGVYASAMLVKMYKDAGGRYSPERLSKKKEKKGIGRWFEEKWINICESKPPDKLVDCGTSQRGYPVCRPYYRVSYQTPMTYGEMEKTRIKEICKDKSKNPLIILDPFVRKKSTTVVPKKK